jgi:hypothetical protein
MRIFLLSAVVVPRRAAWVVIVRWGAVQQAAAPGVLLAPPTLTVSMLLS